MKLTTSGSFNDKSQLSPYNQKMLNILRDTISEVKESKNNSKNRKYTIPETTNTNMSTIRQKKEQESKHKQIMVQESEDMPPPTFLFSDEDFKPLKNKQ